CAVVTRKRSSAEFAASMQLKFWTLQSQHHFVGLATRFLGTYIDIIRTVGKKVVALLRVDNTLKPDGEIIIVVDEDTTSLRGDVLQRVLLNDVTNTAISYSRVDLICRQVVLGVVRGHPGFRQPSRINF